MKEFELLLVNICCYMNSFSGKLYDSARIPCPHPGRIWVEQRGLQRALYWHIEARVVLDLQEFPVSVSNFNSSNEVNLVLPVVICAILDKKSSNKRRSSN